MKNFALLSFLLVTLGTTAPPTAAQNNVPPEVREMALKVNVPVLQSAGEGQSESRWKGQLCAVIVCAKQT
jgi:hypothetical protein